MYNQKGKLQKNPKEELILLHMPLVKKIANNMYKKINFLMDLDDLISVGTLGLMDAVQKYVEMDTAKFETYATIKIKGFILDELRRQDPLNQEERQIKKRIDSIKQENPKIKEQELIAKLNIDVELYQQVLIKDQFSYMISVEENIDKEDSEKSILQIKDESQNIENDLYKKELINNIAKCIDKLDEKEQIVMQLIYVEDLDAKDVAYVLKISPARVSQIHAKSIEKIKLMIR